MRPPTSVLAVLLLLLPIPIALFVSSAQVLNWFDICPSPSAPTLRHVHILQNGHNRSTALPIEFTPSWLPWRATLVEEAGVRRILSEAFGHVQSPHVLYNEQGQRMRCASDIGDGSHIYVSTEGIPWQWAPEAVGHERKVRIRWIDSAFVDGPPGTIESDLELRARSDDLPGDDEDGGSEVRTLVLETLSVSPPIFRVRNLVPNEIVDALVEHASSAFTPSTVGDPSLRGSDGKSVRKRDDRRTSSSHWLHGHNDPRKTLPAARAVQRAVSELIRLAPRHQMVRNVEPLLCVRYDQGEFYEPHHDFFAGDPSSTTPAEDAFTPPQGSNRFATLVLYAEAPDEGGETVFPFASPDADAASSLEGVAYAGGSGDDALACDFPALKVRRGLLVTPRRGDAVLFYNQLPDGSLDGRTRHGSCPVVRGRKMAANVWSWNRAAIYR